MASVAQILKARIFQNAFKKGDGEASERIKIMAVKLLLEDGFTVTEILRFIDLPLDMIVDIRDKKST